MTTPNTPSEATEAIQAHTNKQILAARIDELEIYSDVIAADNKLDGYINRHYKDRLTQLKAERSKLDG